MNLLWVSGSDNVEPHKITVMRGAYNGSQYHIEGYNTCPDKLFRPTFSAGITVPKILPV